MRLKEFCFNLKLIDFNKAMSHEIDYSKKLKRMFKKIHHF